MAARPHLDQSQVTVHLHLLARMSECHNYQWGQTNNALNIFSSYYSYTRDPTKEAFGHDKLREILLETPAVATEKLDGTNVGKDDEGNIYGRRLLIDKGKTSYQRVSLDKVKTADICKVKMEICKVLKIDETELRKFLVFGELICNKAYDYVERDLLSTWKVFGAMIEAVPVKAKYIFQKLLDNHFAVSLDTETKLRIFPCKQFFTVASQCGLEVADIKGEDKSLGSIVSEHTEEMRRGLLEGLVFTLYNRSSGQHYLVKWKGAQEHQPTAHEALGEVISLLEADTEVGEEVSTFYRNLHEVAQADSCVNEKVKENELNKSNKKAKNQTKKQSNGEQKNKTERHVGKNDMKLIVDGVYHSMKKFDDLEVYKENGDEGIQNYITILQEESRRHFIEEKHIMDNFTEDDEVIKFINATVTKIVLRKV